MTIEVKEYHFQQTNVPPIAGTAGYGITLLDAVLVTGFNSVNISTLVVSSNLATVTTSGNHGFNQDEVIKIAGANESVFNNEFRVKEILSLTSFTFEITTADTTATGSITAKIAGLGWTKAFTGTNKAAYRSSDVSGTQLYLRVDDTNAQYMSVKLYETMTDIDAGTGASVVRYWMKSDVSNTTAKNWNIIGDSKMFYFLVDWDSTYSNQPNPYCFGDINSVKSGDAYHCILYGYHTIPSDPYQYLDFASIGSPSDTEGALIARSYTQLGSALAFFKYAGIPGSSYMGYGSTITFPDPVDNGIHLVPVYVFLTASNLRGVMPGLYSPIEQTNGVFNTRDKTVKINNKIYIAYKISNGVSNNQIGNCWFDLTGPWRE